MGQHRLALLPELSFQSLHATGSGDAAFPPLWDDASLAVFCTMGPSRIVPDFSSRNEVYGWVAGHASEYVRKNGVWRYRFDNSGDRATMGTMDDIIGSGDVTILLGYEKTDGTLRASGAFGNNSTVTNRLCGSALPFTDGYVYFSHGGNTDGTSRVNTNTHGSGAITPGDDDYAFVAGRNRGMEIWQNGNLIANHSGFTARIQNSADLLQWGFNNGSGADLTDYKYMVVYQRALSPQEIREFRQFPQMILVPRSDIITAAGTGIIGRSVSNDLTVLSDDASGVRDIAKSVSDPMTNLDDQADHSGDWTRSVSENLGLGDQADFLSRSVSDTIYFTSGLIEFLAVDDFKPISHTLNLTQTVISGSNRTVIDPMTLVQVARPSIINQNVAHSMGIQDGVLFCFGAPWAAIEIEDVIDFAQVVGKGLPFSISDTLNLSDSAIRANTASHFISFVQEAIAGTGKFVVSVMDLNHNLGTENVFGRTLTHENVVQDAMAYYIDTPCAVKQYNRFEGSGPLDGIAEEPLTFNANFSLETLSGPKTLLSLRNPETDDSQRIGFSRVNRETSGGEINVYSDPDWPQIKTLLFTIVAISDGKGNCPDKLTDLFDFMQTNLGLEILLHDWEGISWRGVVTTPNEVATEDRDGWWTFAFEFQGEDLDGSQGDQDLAISQTLLLNADWVRSISDNMTLEQDMVVSGILQENVSDPLSITDSGSALNDTLILSDDFSGSSGTDLHGQSPDTGASTWSAHTNYKADGSQTAINSGAYYPFVPVNGTIYEIVWKPRSMTHSDGLASWFFLGEGLNSDPDSTGTTAWGRFDPTTLKSGFGIRRISGTQLNTCRLGDETDGLADNVDMTDATLKAMTTNIDLRVDLDTTGGTNNWKTTWYAKDTGSSTWTQVRAEADLLSEDITMVGWSNDNSTIVVDMLSITVTEKVSV